MKIVPKINKATDLEEISTGIESLTGIGCGVD